MSASSICLNFLQASFQSKFVSTGRFLLNEKSAEEKEGEKSKVLDPAKDRSKIIPVETSIQYMKSTGKLSFIL